jgi:hypothetical protein
MNYYFSLKLRILKLSPLRVFEKRANEGAPFLSMGPFNRQVRQVD